MISVIVAVARGGVIGAGGVMPWHISEDLQMFKRVTSGHPVVMGRRTFESLGRPLPKRTNVVITRQTDYRAEGCTVVHSLDRAIGLFPPEEEIFVIGGGEIYAGAMPLADRFYLTHIEAEYEGDTFFPEWMEVDWALVSTERHERGANFPHPFEFRVYERRR
ncbi:MAG: dihydrofolate reductase [Alistipes sp.]|jgi:dihydrofolate reductase|nr:dihydrofolate reductase [Alistipes sp.]